MIKMTIKDKWISTYLKTIRKGELRELELHILIKSQKSLIKGKLILIYQIISNNEPNQIKQNKKIINQLNSQLKTKEIKIKFIMKIKELIKISLLLINNSCIKRREMLIFNYLITMRIKELKVQEYLFLIHISKILVM